MRASAVNITNENISLKHYIPVTGSAEPFRRTDLRTQSYFGEFYNSEIFDLAW